MAIARGAEVSVLNPYTNFFKLDFNELATPILKKDAEFKQQEQDLGAFGDTLDSLQFLEKDQQVAELKRNQLHEQEQALRDSVGGNILDPRYQNNLRKLLRQTTGDQFYRNAATNLQEVERWKKFKAEYATKFGAEPPAYLDPFSQQFQEFQNSETSGVLSFQGIASKLDFQQASDQRAQALVATQLGKGIKNGGWDSETDTNGNTVYYNSKNEIVTADQIVELLTQDVSLLQGPAGQQLLAEYESTPELQQQYGSFENYARQHFLTSAGTFAIDAKNTSISQIIRPTTSGEYVRGRTKGHDGSESDNLVPPTSVTSFGITGFVGQGSTLASPDSRVLQAHRDTLKEGHDQAVKDTEQSLKTRFGLDQLGGSIELVDADGKYEMVIDYPAVTHANGEVTPAATAVIDITDRRSIDNAPPHIRQMIQKNLHGTDGLASQFLALANEATTLQEYDNFMQFAKKQVGLDEREEAKWINENIKTDWDAKHSELTKAVDDALANNASTIGNKLYRRIDAETILPFLTQKQVRDLNQKASEISSIRESGASTEDAVDALARDYLTRNLKDNPALVDRFKRRLPIIAKDLAIEDAELRYKPREDYNAYVENAFYYGLDANGNPNIPDDSATGGAEGGVRQVETRRLTVPFADSKQELTKFKPAFLKDIDDSIRTVVSLGDRSNSAIPLVDPITNKRLTSQEYQEILGGEISNLYFRHDTGDGIVIDVAYSFKDGDTVLNKMYEIRDIDMVANMMARAGLGGITALYRQHDALKSFKDETTFEDTGVSIQVPKTANVGLIGYGEKARQLIKLTIPKKDPVSGAVGRPGQFGMRRNDGSMSFFDSVHEADLAYVQDMSELELQALSDSQAITLSKESFNNSNLTFKSDNVNLKFKKPMAQAMLTYPASAPKLNITSATDSNKHHVAGGDHSGWGFDASWDEEAKQLTEWLKTPTGKKWQAAAQVEVLMEIPGAKDQAGNLLYQQEKDEAIKRGFNVFTNNRVGDDGKHLSTGPHLHVRIDKNHPLRQLLKNIK